MPGLGSTAHSAAAAAAAALLPLRPGAGETRKGVDKFLEWVFLGRRAAAPGSSSVISEQLPAGVEPMSARYGTYGSRMLKEGGPLDRGRTAPLPCPDAEAQPPPPCARTGECGELLRLARKFQLGMEVAEQQLKAARVALEYSQVLLRRVHRGLDGVPRNLRLSRVMAADSDPEEAADPDMDVKILYGPLEESWPLNHGSNAYILPRIMARWDQDKRAAVYLQRAEGNDAPGFHGRDDRDLGVGPALRLWEAAAVLPLLPLLPSLRSPRSRADIGRRRWRSSVAAARSKFI